MIDETIIVKNEDKTILVEEVIADVQHNETVEVVKVGVSNPTVVRSQSAFPAIGEDNKELNHANLHGRYTSKQHNISSIEGLRAELDIIEELQPIYSDKKQYADYYMWHD